MYKNVAYKRAYLDIISQLEENGKDFSYYVEKYGMDPKP